jgi:ADP-ribosyl-[dinitrogen reductase] hydrolase
MSCTLREAVYAAALGDALGAPVRGKRRGSYGKVDHMQALSDDGKPAGTWTDDTSLTLATCDSIRHCHGIDVKDMRKRFEQWLFHGAYTQDGSAFDIGMTTQRALLSRNGASDQMSNGNGSLMRILPLAFVPHVSEEDIRAVSSITHAHELSCESCVFYVRLLRFLKRNLPLRESIRDAAWRTRYTYLVNIDERDRKDIRSDGYVVHTLEAVLWCILTTRSWEEAVETAVELGDDTDTIGSITAGLAAVLYGGEKNFPPEWVAVLRRKDMIDRVLFEEEKEEPLNG